MKRIELALKSVGLSEVESKIYLALLEFGTMGISDLVKSAGIHRTEAYRVLPHLQELHLVSKAMKGKRHVFNAESPDRVEDLFASFAQNFQKIIPELRSIYQKKEDSPKYSYFQGRTAIRDANSGIIAHLPKGGCYYRLSSGRHSDDHYAYYKENYSAERDRKMLERMIITSEFNRSSDPKDPNRSVMAIPDGFDHFDDHISKVIYGDKVTIIDYLSETGFTIESARYARYEEKVFRLLFRLLAKDGNR